MEKTKLDQIRDKIYDHMLSVDLSKLPSYELISYINAFKTLEGGAIFPGLGFSGWGLGCAANISAPARVDTSEEVKENSND